MKILIKESKKIKGLYTINKKALEKMAFNGESIINTFKRIMKINDINIVNLVKENTKNYYFSITQLF